MIHDTEINTLQKDTNNSVENNTVEYIFRQCKIRASIFGAVKGSVSKRDHFR